MLLITDQSEDRKKLESHLIKEGILNFESTCITDGISYWNSKTPVDLVVIYILNPDLRMLENIIKCINPSIKILITTDHRFTQYVNVVNISSKDYISEIIRFIKNFNPVQSSPQSTLKDDILIKINDKYKRIRFDNIDYIKADGKYVSIHVKDRAFSIRTTLKEIMEILPDNFIRSHASYIINIDKVESIQMHDQNIEMAHVNLPFSRKYKNNIFDRFHIG